MGLLGVLQAFRTHAHTLSLSLCVYTRVSVCVWNIWRDVKLLPVAVAVHRFFIFHFFNTYGCCVFQTPGGQEPMTVCPGQRRPDSMGVKTYLQFSIFHFVVHGNRLSPEPACRFDFHLDFCTVVAICQLISSSTGHGDGTFSFFLGSFHRPIPVRCNWSVFARKMHSTSEFAKIVLSKCVCWSYHPSSCQILL